MAILILGLILFFVPHSVALVSADWRDAQVRRFGELPWKAGYGLVSLAGLVLIIWGYGEARQAPTLLWAPSRSLFPVTSLLMLPVFPLLVAAYVPSRIKRWTRHPMLIAVILWAIAHLLVNGTLADLLLFGVFLVWAVLDLFSFSRRTPRDTPHVPMRRGGDILVIVLGLAIYAAFVVWLHGWLIGVSLVG
ncbi:NnrU family protein [Pistricoccus aurantiacus]|uniref:NnrU family protein n=1 Tax=Pistricoccus aurantiacus TaxID=1883414 RepID=UPI00363BE1AD